MLGTLAPEIPFLASVLPQVPPGREKREERMRAMRDPRKFPRFAIASHCELSGVLAGIVQRPSGLRASEQRCLSCLANFGQSSCLIGTVELSFEGGWWEVVQ
jgi:hypothetical protein